MLRLSLPERAGRSYFGHHITWPEPRGIDVGDCLVRDLFLFVVRVEDGRTIACSSVVPLPVQSSRIMNLEEEFQQLSITDLLRIEHDFDRFSVSSMIR